MKKKLTVLLCLIISCLIVSNVSYTAFAISPNDEKVLETVKYYDDGTYMVITVLDKTPNQMRSSQYYKSGSKTYTLYNKDGVELWHFTVHGTFLIDPGSTVTCTSATYNISISNSAWNNASASSYPSGNQAIGDATFQKSLYSITVETANCHVVLTCDSNGNFS